MGWARMGWDNVDERSAPQNNTTTPPIHGSLLPHALDEVVGMGMYLLPRPCWFAVGEVVRRYEHGRSQTGPRPPRLAGHALLHVR